MEISNLTIAQSEKKHLFYDVNKKAVGYVSRFYKNPIEKSLSYLGLNNLFTNVCVEDEGGTVRVLFHMSSNFLSVNTTWKVTMYSGSRRTTLELKQVPKIGVTKRFQFEMNSRTYTVIDNTIGTEPCFYNDQGNVIAKCYDSLGAQKKIDINNEEVDLYYISGVCFLISLL